jgi:hypothetical protein
MHYPDVTAAMAVTIVRLSPAQYHRAFDGVPDDAARRRPDPSTWSMIEYVCHVRDVYRVFVDRIGLALAADGPTFAPLGNDERAVRLRYGEADVDATLADLTAAAVGLADLVESLPDSAWARTASRRPGEERNVLWMARQSAHEGRHHLGDVERVRRLVM